MKTKFFLVILFAWSALFAQKLQVNVGTAAPEGSPWHEILQKTRQDWNRISGGNLTVRIYPSGVLGDEVEMIRKARIGQLQAVAVSGVGLSHIEPAAGCLQIPMLMGSYEEFDYVRERIAPRLESLIAQKGFIVLQWSDVGWVHFFTKKPAKTPDDIRKLRLFTSAGDPEGERLYKEFGLQVVPLAVTDMLPSLQTNLIQAFDVPPLFAMLDQSFGLAPNMIDVKWTPLAGATLLSRKTWDRIPAEQRTELLRASRSASAGVRAQVRKMGEDAIVEMQKRGLNVIKLDPATLSKWQVEAKSSYPKIRGEVVPADLFDEVVRLHNEYLSRMGGKG
ncbi:MAG TPA: TRAP transporter substrate-binding protein DctP [Bryobacteraceae bacterium]|nr:TRAP transporter substrate-binding protein DctP [Bryobacteraceae bacterium]